MIKSVKIDNLDLIKQIQVTFSDVYVQKNQLKNDLLNNPYTKIYIYVENGVVMGLIHINDIYDRYEVYYIYVLQEFRQRGIALKLMQYVINLGKENNIINITLEVKEDNLAAINLYKKLGFIEKSVRKGYYKGVDGILMEKEMM